VGSGSSLCCNESSKTKGDQEMTDCYECFKEAKITELVIYEDDGNWKLGCIQCVKPKNYFSAKVRELREDEK
jgi:hypothetical protein